MTRVEPYEVISRAYFIEDKSRRQISQELGVHRRDVRRAIGFAVPPERQEPEREAPVLGPHKAVIDRWLGDDTKRRPKHRHTWRGIAEMLMAARIDE